MDLLKAQLEKIRQQLAGLSASQKMLTGALVVIMAMTMVWWLNYAGTPSMEPLLDQPFSSDDISRVTARMAARGISYTVNGEKVLVPTERKFEALADLGYAQLLPRDTRSGFDEIVKQMSPWDPVNKQQVMWNRAKEMTLAQLIRGFPSVANAAVIIDPTTQRHVGESVRPSATVNITMRNGEKPSKQLVQAAADLVAGAVSGMQRGRIAVVVDGVSFPLADKDSPDLLAGNNDIIELIQVNERHYAGKVSDHLAYIRGVLVSVTVELNTKSSQTTRKTIDPNVIQKEVEVETSTEETTSPAVAGLDPGTGANVSVSIPSGAGATGGSTSEHTLTKFQNFSGESVETIRSPAGSASVVAASVRVPVSYFQEIYRRRNAGQEADDAALTPLITAELAKIREAVKACTGLKTDQSVSVDTYVDAAPPATEQAGTAIASVGNVSVLLGSHAKEIAVGVLAAASLFMAMMMVRKSAPAVAVPEQIEREPQRLAGDEGLAGEASEAHTALEGMELDEDTLKAQQMLDQVSTLVKENPDAAANMVKRWLNRS